jgi:hypothetical protein
MVAPLMMGGRRASSIGFITIVALRTNTSKMAAIFVQARWLATGQTAL